MAELTISADEIRTALEEYVSSYSPDVSREEVGTVAETGDGIARVEGLPSAMTNELLRFEDERRPVPEIAAELAEARSGDERIWIMKPQTFMNHSGEAVGPALKFWKLGPEDLVVLHDDLELDPLRVQLKVGGGHGGHNGLRDIQNHLGTTEYARLRWRALST